MFFEILRAVALGIPMTLLVAAASWLLASVLGGVIAYGYYSNSTVRSIADFISMFLRGIPEVVALFLVFFGLQQYVALSTFEAAVIAFGVVASPFAAEIYRGALHTVGAGQRPAAISLGLSPTRTFISIIAPQATRFAIPPMLNLLIGMLNVTAVAAAIGIPVVIQKSDIVLRSATEGFTFFYATLSVCIIYLAIVLPLQSVSAAIEKKLSTDLGVPNEKKPKIRGQRNSVPL